MGCTSPSGMTPRVRSAEVSNESKAKRPCESPTKNLVPSSFARLHLESVRKTVGELYGTYAVTSHQGHSTVAFALRFLISRPLCFSFTLPSGGRSAPFF